MIKRIINGKIYSFQFGIKCVILPKSFSKINSDEARKLLFTEILIEKQDSEKLLEVLSDSQIEQIIISAFQQAFITYSFKGSSFCDFLFFLLSLGLSEEVDQLFAKAVGEAGVSPAAFFQMTPKQVELAYMGYIKRMELETNCMLAAARRSRTTNSQLISLLRGQDYGLSTLEQRERTFKTLNIS